MTHERYTAGPWFIPRSHPEFIASQEAYELEDWDNVWICQWGAYTNEANARLILQAPTMAEYIKERATAGDIKAISILKEIEGS